MRVARRAPMPSRPPAKEPWEDPSLGLERESRATHRRRRERETRALDAPASDADEEGEP